MSRQKVQEKMKAIGVSDRMAQRYFAGTLPPPQRAMLDKLLLAGVREPFAVRAVERGLTEDDIMWNERLGRPINFIEADKAVEAERRDDWIRTHPATAGVPPGAA